MKIWKNIFFKDLSPGCYAQLPWQPVQKQPFAIIYLKKE